MHVKFAFKQLLLKSQKKSLTISTSRRYIAYFLLVRFPRVTYKNHFNKRCIISGRVWSTNNLTGLSRFELRRSVYKSNIPGFRRAS